jgi:hypothetical protein
MVFSRAFLPPRGAFILEGVHLAVANNPLVSTLRSMCCWLDFSGAVAATIDGLACHAVPNAQHSSRDF